MKKLKLGILKETKTPPDKRVALPPRQCVYAQERFPGLEITVQPSDIRAYTNSEYAETGITLSDNIGACDILIGVKEVDIQSLIPEKTYMFFSHTAKKQEHNRELLQAIVKKKITLIDYEYLTDIDGIRLVAFGRWAGIVGAYNGLIGYGLRNKIYDLKRASQCHDMDELLDELHKITAPPPKTLITGGGRVAHGAMEVMEHINIQQVKPQEFLSQEFDYPVFCQIDPWHYTRRMDDGQFDMDHFLKYPNEYESAFQPYMFSTDMLVACHYWDPKSPVLMTRSDMQNPEFRIKVIADISCDINGSIPSTIRASSIEKPFYGFNPFSNTEIEPFDKESITVMAVDNLPGEAPRNASIDFGNDLIEKVFPFLIGEDKQNIIERATIVKNGRLTKPFLYLEDFLQGR